MKHASLVAASDYLPVATMDFKCTSLPDYLAAIVTQPEKKAVFDTVGADAIWIR